MASISINSSSPLTLKRVFQFWFPLSLNWQMMAIEAPVITGVIARMPDPEINLAAFGVAFAWALIIESPVISLLSAGAALGKDRESYVVLRRFMWHMNLLSTVLQLIFILPPVFHFVMGTVLNLPPEVSSRAYMASVILIPWSASIGYRRLYQGISIRGGMTKRVALGTVIRMSVMAASALFFYQSGALNGASVACLSLTLAVAGEAIGARVLAAPVLKTLLRTEPIGRALSYRQLFRFYLPLMLTILIGFGAQPLTTLALGHGVLPLESLAVLPVINSLVIFVMGSVFAVQEITIVLVGEDLEHRAVLRNFSWLLGGALSSVLAIFAFTPIGSFWFINVSQLPLALVPLAFLALKMAVVTPMFRSWEAYQRALLVKAHQTRLVTVVAVCELIIICIMLYVLTQIESIPGVVAAILSIAGGVASAVFVLIYYCRKFAGDSALAKHR